MKPSEEQEIEKAVLRLNSRILGITVGLVFGLLLFVATNWLVLKGGENVGAHLVLLRQYFPGYSVTFIGSIIGFVYAFILGYVVGSVIAYVYNRFAQPQNPTS